MIPTVPCPDLEPLTVSMSCHKVAFYGSPPTFTATANKDAIFTFYVDEDPQISSVDLSDRAEFTPDASIASGKHQVHVVAKNGSQSDKKTCEWTVLRRKLHLQM